MNVKLIINLQWWPPTCPTKPGQSWALHPRHQRRGRELSLSHCCKPRPLSWKRALSLSSFHKFASILIPDSADLHHFHNLVCQCLPNARQGQGLLPSGKQIEPCIRFVKVWNGFVKVVTCICESCCMDFLSNWGINLLVATSKLGLNLLVIQVYWVS